MATAKNTNVVRSIAAPAGAVGDDCTHISLWDAQQNGNFLQSQQISTDPAALALGERYEIAAEALVINQPAGANESADMSERAVRGRIAGGVWVQFHSGAPGAQGTDNVIAELGRVQIAQGGFTVAQ